MRMHLAAAALLAAATATATAADARRGSRPSAACAVVGRGEWSAHVNAMPGPGARPTLIVSGTIGVKPAARTRLRLDPAVMESDPPQYSVILEVQLPRTPTIDMLERRQVRGQWPVSGPVGAVHVRCGGRIIATIRNVVTAH